LPLADEEEGRQHQAQAREGAGEQPEHRVAQKTVQARQREDREPRTAEVERADRRADGDERQQVDGSRDHGTGMCGPLRPAPLRDSS
jgi:hypothetical protein